jgi:hypothetical protein
MGQLACIETDDVDTGGCFRIRKRLTARTLNSEVLPAFCNPIMVMSISVALYGVSGHQPGHVIVARDLAFSWAQAEQLAEYQIAHQAGIRAMAFDMVRKGQVGIPEQAEQPVVDATEEVRHGGCQGDF